MIELGLTASLFFILIAIIASYLLKSVLEKNQDTSSNIEKTKIIAIGMPPISSVKVRYIVPGIYLQGIKNLGNKGSVYLFIVRASFFLAVLAVIISIIFETWLYA